MNSYPKSYSALFCLLLTLGQIFWQTYIPVLALETPLSDTEFTQQYTKLTKEILLSGVELERFSLHYRVESFKQPKFRRMRVFLAQETAASCSLAFEIIGDKQFEVGRRHPLRISQNALKGAAVTAATGSIIAGSDSILESLLSAWQEAKARQHGFDAKSANKFVIAKLNHIDDLLAKRDVLIEAHRDNPAYARAVVEGKILHSLRSAFIDEYAGFHANAKQYATFANWFFLFNAATNAVGATAALMAYKAVKNTKLNGPVNILFVITGALTIATPLLSAAGAKLAYKHDHDSFLKEIGEKPEYDSAELKAFRKQLQELSSTGEGSLMPSLPAVDRLALYTESNHLFDKQLKNETTTMKHLEKVAVESTLLGPIIGGTFLTQGILGTVGYYKYTFQPKKQLSLDYRGAIVGTTGAGLATVATAAWLLASLSYEHKLKKEKRLPNQLIDARLAHLDEVEKMISAL